MNAPKPVLSPSIKHISEGLTLVEPISRCGQGPGLIILVDHASSGLYLDDGVPSAMQKWGEESFTVVEITAKALEQQDVLRSAIKAAQSSEKCTGGFGIVAYDVELWNALYSQIQDQSDIKAAVIYAEESKVKQLESTVPVLIHVAGKNRSSRTANRVEHSYPTQSSASFASPRTKYFDYATEAVSHTRSLAHLKKYLSGPYFDLEALWEEHTYFEFEVRDVEATMNTMVQEPYVNHIPTLTGGVGRKNLTDFYTNHFVFSNPNDTELELISRTVGIDRVIDEFIFKFTHDRIIDWLLPGVPPTNRYVEIPFMAVVNIRGDRLYHEHITWDHASALRQVGVLAETLPYGQRTNGVVQEQVMVLPVGGKETAAKLRDKNAIPSNLMFTSAGVKTVSSMPNGKLH